MALIAISECRFDMDQYLERLFANTSNMFRDRLKRDIAVIVAIKILIILCAGLFVFGPGARPHVDSTSVHDQMLRNFPSDQNNGNFLL